MWEGHWRDAGKVGELYEHLVGNETLWMETPSAFQQLLVSFNFPKAPGCCSSTMARSIPGFCSAFVTALESVLEQVLANAGSCCFCAAAWLSAAAGGADAGVLFFTELNVLPCRKPFTALGSSAVAWLSGPLAVSACFCRHGASVLLPPVLQPPVVLLSSSPLESLCDFAEHRRLVMVDLAESWASQRARNFISLSLFPITALYIFSSPSVSSSNPSL